MYNKVLYLISLLSILCVYTSWRVYESYVDQNFLIQAGRGQFTNYSEKYVLGIEGNFPNITATTIAIESVKANLLLNIGNYSDTILKMIDKGRKSNRYLFYEDALTSVYYLRNKNFDSAYKYAKKAYYGHPNHQMHQNLLYDLIEAIKDSSELESAYRALRKPISDSFTKRYLETLNDVSNKIDKNKENMIKDFLVTTDNKENKNYAQMLLVIADVGKRNVEKGILAAIEGEKLFRDENFLESAKKFEEAYYYNPKEVSYYENAANAYMQLNLNEKAINILNNVLSNLNPQTGKSEYLLGLILSGEKKYSEGCDFFKKAIVKGFIVGDNLLDYVCEKK